MGNGSEPQPVGRVEFSVPGEPVAKGRARAFIRGRGTAGAHVAHYTPDKTTEHEHRVRTAWRAATGGEVAAFLGPVRVDLVFVRSIPASFSKKKRALALDARLRPTTKPDLDNLVKLVVDALNGGIAFRDDAQIALVSAAKLYGETAHTLVRITSLEEEA